MSKVSRSSLWISFALLLAATPMWASVYLGSIATESGVPISGQEDIVVFNFTGPSQGCSTPSGTPICTAVTFDNVTLTINGTDTLDLGDVAPGMTESYTFPSGIYPDGAITSLSFAATLSTTTLIDDLSNNYAVDPGILEGDLPVDGSFADIVANPASAPAVPEPAFYVPGAFLVALCLARRSRVR